MNKPPLPPSGKSNDDAFKQRLIEKKQQQWKQENGTVEFSSISLFLSLLIFSGKNAIVESIRSAWCWRTEYQRNSNKNLSSFPISFD
jgi:hypothetical protein